MQTGLLVVACLVVVGVLLFAVYERAADQASQQLLTDTTSHIDAAAEAPAGIQVVVVTPRGRSVSPGMPEGLPDEGALRAVAADGRTRQDDVELRGHEFTIRTEKVGGRVTQAVLDRHEFKEERSRLLSALLVAALVGVVLSGLLAGWLARRAVAPLGQTLSLQRRFVADASHELRTPLTLLSTRVQLLARRLRVDEAVDEQAVAADVEGILRDTEVLTEVLDDLLIAADPRPGAAPESIELLELVEECVGAATASAVERGVALSRGPSQQGVVLGSRASLRRAVTALVDNAIGHASSVVEVTVRRAGSRLELVVADDGPGIPPGVAEHVFDRFSSTRRGGHEQRHYGLGLALVADVADAHAGRVTAGGRVDGRAGAMLVLSLPGHRPGSVHAEPLDPSRP